MLSLMLVAALAIGTLATPAVAHHHQLIDAGNGAGPVSRGSSTTGCADDGTSAVSGSSNGANPAYAERPDSWSHFVLGDFGAIVTSVDGRVGVFRLCGEVDYESGVLESIDNAFPQCVVHNGKGSIQIAGEPTLWLRNVQSYDVATNGNLPNDGSVPDDLVTTIRGDVVAAADAAAAAAMTPRHSFYAALRISDSFSLCNGNATRQFTMDFLITDKAVDDLTTL